MNNNISYYKNISKRLYIVLKEYFIILKECIARLVF